MELKLLCFFCWILTLLLQGESVISADAIPYTSHKMTESYKSSRDTTVSSSMGIKPRGTSSSSVNYKEIATTESTEDIPNDTRPKTRLTSITTATDKTAPSSGEMLTESTSAASEEAMTTLIPEECKPDNCTSPHICSFNRPSGCLVKPEEDLQRFSYTITLANKTSIVHVRMIAADVFLSPESNMTVLFFDDGEMEVWEFSSEHPIPDRSYFSKTSSLVMRFYLSATTSTMRLNYEEVKFEQKIVRNTSNAGIMEPPSLVGRYRPNSMTTFVLTPPEGQWIETSVMVTLKSLDVDEVAGEYLIIGAGNETFSGPPAMYLTGHIAGPKKFYVANEEVFVVFVATTSKKKGPGFQLSWQRIGKKITVPDQKPDETVLPDYVLQSSPICFYNASWLQEFNKTEDQEDPFPSFREKLAELANSYAKDKGLQIIPPLKADSVNLFRVSSVIPPDPEREGLQDGALYVMVSIRKHFDKDAAIFQYKELREILDRFNQYDEENGHALMGFKIGRCPSGVDYHWWYIVAILLIPLSTLLLLAVWGWRHNSHWKSRRLRKSNYVAKRSAMPLPLDLCTPESAFPSPQNEYVQYTPGYTLPELRVTMEKGESFFVNEIDDEVDLHYSPFTKSLIGGPEVELFNRNWILKRRSSQADVSEKTAFDSSEADDGVKRKLPLPGGAAKGRSRPTLLWRESNLEKLLDVEQQPTEHLYDSLDVDAKGTLLKNEDRTRL